MKQVTKNELIHLEKYNPQLDWYTLKNKIPKEIKDDMEDELLFELVRPWPFERGNSTGYRSTLNGQGGTMDYRFLESSVDNFEFFKKHLQKYNPKYILETGTNAGILSWFCFKFLKEFELHTIDFNEESEFFINKIQNYFNESKSSNKGIVHFYKDTSPECFDNQWWNDNEFKTKKFDLAFLDAGHHYSMLYGELQAAKKLDIPVIFVDDWQNPDLDKAITDFEKETDYNIIFSKEGLEPKKVGYVKILEKEGYTK
tara:strand:+ start:111 stop:878 length:768 start_codon:yes stop_codon:yes gene_type:complete